MQILDHPGVVCDQVRRDLDLPYEHIHDSATHRLPVSLGVRPKRRSRAVHGPARLGDPASEVAEGGDIRG